MGEVEGILGRLKSSAFQHELIFYNFCHFFWVKICQFWWKLDLNCSNFSKNSIFSSRKVFTISLNIVLWEGLNPKDELVLKNFTDLVKKFRMFFYLKTKQTKLFKCQKFTKKVLKLFLSSHANHSHLHHSKQTLITSIRSKKFLTLPSEDSTIDFMSLSKSHRSQQLDIQTQIKPSKLSHKNPAKKRVRKTVFIMIKKLKRIWNLFEIIFVMFTFKFRRLFLLFAFIENKVFVFFLLK